MPVVSTPLSSSLRIIVEAGVDQDNKPIYRTRSYNNVKTGASDEDVMSIANMMADMQVHPVYAIRRVIETELTEIS